MFEWFQRAIWLKGHVCSLDGFGLELSQSRHVLPVALSERSPAPPDVYLHRRAALGVEGGRGERYSACAMPGLPSFRVQVKNLGLSVVVAVKVVVPVDQGRRRSIPKRHATTRRLLNTGAGSGVQQHCHRERAE